MNIEILRDEKNDLEIQMDNQTIAEILRMYLNEQGIQFAAWRREHPSKPIIFKIESTGKTARKAISEAVEAIKKDADKIVSATKK